MQMKRLPAQLVKSLFALALIVSVSLSGCKKNDFEVARASGTIKTASGELLPSGIITFTPQAMTEKSLSGKSAYAEIENGKFVLSTYGKGDGAVVGTHKVTLTESWRPDAEDIENRTDIAPRHGCMISPESVDVVVVAGEDNVFELLAVRKQRQRGEERED